MSKADVLGPAAGKGTTTGDINQVYKKYLGNLKSGDMKNKQRH